jgi:hypothetical protein
MARGTAVPRDFIAAGIGDLSGTKVEALPQLPDPGQPSQLQLATMTQIRTRNPCSSSMPRQRQSLWPLPMRAQAHWQMFLLLANALDQASDVAQPLFSRVFTAIFQGFSRVLFPSRVFRSESYKYLGAATDSRRHVPEHMLPTNI